MGSFYEKNIKCKLSEKDVVIQNIILRITLNLGFRLSPYSVESCGGGLVKPISINLYPTLQHHEI